MVRRQSQHENAAMQDLKGLIRTIPDYPKKGIMFRDVTTLLGNARGFKAAIEQMAAPYAGGRVEAVAGIEARGFILGGAIADRLGCGFVPIRKKGKLPWKTIGQEYTLEYGVDIIESGGKPYVVDISSMPGFKGVPDAASHLASYFHRAAERAAHARHSVGPEAPARLTAGEAPA